MSPLFPNAPSIPALALVTRVVSLVAFLSVGPVMAKLPELDAVFFGRVLHKGTEPAVPNLANQLAVIAKLDGIEIARAILSPSSSQYLLKIPLDDGVEPRLPGTARRQERIRVYVLKTADNIEQEVAESVSGLFLSSVKGDVRSLDVRISGDLGLPVGPSSDVLRQWADQYGLNYLSISQNSDFDNDGVPDLDEYTAGTEPNNVLSKLQVIQTIHNNGVTSVQYGPVRVGRLYRIYFSATMAPGSWSEIGSASPTEDAAGRWFDHVTTVNPGFYQITVVTQ
jgi:hypothetical protein